MTKLLIGLLFVLVLVAAPAMVQAQNGLIAISSDGDITHHDGEYDSEDWDEVTFDIYVSLYDQYPYPVNVYAWIKPTGSTENYQMWYVTGLEPDGFYSDDAEVQAGGWFGWVPHSDEGYDYGIKVFRRGFFGQNLELVGEDEDTVFHPLIGH